MTISTPLTREQYRAALDAVLPELPLQQYEVLERLLHAPNHTASAGEIAKQLGIHHLTVNALLANTGRRVLREITRASTAPVTTEFEFFWQVMAQKGDQGVVKGFPWELRPEVVDALRNSNLLEGNHLLTDEPLNETPLCEGASSQSVNTVRSRNAMARAQCLSTQKAICVACGIDMGQLYGSEFSDCIHVHHLTPLSHSDGPRQVNPSTDLVPVCPNCHAVIHAHGQLRTPLQVSNLLKKAHPK